MYRGEIIEVKKKIKRLNFSICDAAVKSIRITSKQACDIVCNLMEKKDECLYFLSKIEAFKSSLDKKYQLIFELYFEKELLTEDIAKKLNISCRTLFRKLNRLEKNIISYGL
jgi:DNA-directed RNA polymerase specialized sigma subunit